MRLPTLSLYLFNIVLEILAEQLDNKRMSKGYKLERKKSQYHYLQILYISDPKNSTRELLNLINILSQVAGYNFNSNKSMAFLYTKDKQTERGN